VTVLDFEDTLNFALLIGDAQDGLVPKHRYAVCSIPFSPDGKTLAAGGGLTELAGEVRLWDVATRAVRANLEALARYDGLLAAIPNVDVLLSPMTTQEAVLSSRIEGTQATMGEVLEYEAVQSPEAMDPAKRRDIEEVLNYRRATIMASQPPHAFLDRDNRHPDEFR
jgi:Fic/DOC family N-terminal